MKKVVPIIAATLLAPAVFAEPAHIADDVYVFMNSGPSNQYRINGRVTSGEPVTVIERRDDYIQIRTEGGRVGWVPAPFVASGISQLSEMPALREALVAREKQVNAQQQEIDVLKQAARNRQQESESSRAQVDQLEHEIAELKAQISNMDQSNLIRWLTHGGLVALGGVVLGLLVPHLPKRRKPRNEWF